MMTDDDDATVFQTEDDRKQLEKEILRKHYDVDIEDDTAFRED